VDIELARFGSDRAGLLCGYLFASGHAGRTIEAEEAADLLSGKRTLQRDEFLWLHFNLSNMASERWLRQRLELPEAFHDSLTRVQSTRIEVAGHSVVTVINDVRVFGLDASSVSTVALCLQATLLVSARRTPLRSVERLRDCVRAGETFRSSVELLSHLLRDQAHVLLELVHELAEQVDRIEDRLAANQLPASRGTLGQVRRMLVRHQRLLAPEPAALFRLLNRPPDWIGASDMQDLREAAEELAASVTESSALIERVRLLQEEMFALVNEQTSRTLFVLTIVTVLALPMTIVSGFFGMNVGGVPLQEHPRGFWIVVAVVLAVCLVGTVLALRRRPDH
jgi:zinc transporter